MIKHDSMIESFLAEYPRMRFRPTVDGTISLVGRFPFSASAEGLPDLTDEYRIRIDIVDQLDKALPVIYETGGRIPSSIDNHVNGDRTLCLGSPLSQRLKLGAKPTLTRFVELCLVPFLYAQSLREKGIAQFPFGELAHGSQGLIDDYMMIFGVEDTVVLMRLLDLLSMKRRRANKLPCPCGCGRRFARCRLHATANRARAILSRWDIKRAYKQLQGQIEPDEDL
ncbi:hypothetical protein [Pseudomonas syringae]|uniref:Uncharacterized conserved protein YecA n=1 Tax=Pseudomonas syringae pv. actinidiae TaxID=103796 RepID=A0A2V0Q812_PSESF|nr:hypothetical protein [Pseudomonas syringae]GBH08814.1 Uncharacterized conserved protein YecA [Pseudomonas syringae pv. actinidiae]